MDRRWSPGMVLSIDGLSIRVVPGKKADGDLRLEWRVDGRWRPVTMTSVAVLADFFADNEDWHFDARTAHARSWTNPGGEYFLEFLREAATGGWRGADARLQAQKAAKASHA